MTSESEAYVRGLDAGRIEQRLQAYDDRFRRLEGSVETLTQALEVLTDEVRADVVGIKAGRTSDRRDVDEREHAAVTVASALAARATTLEAAKTNRWTSWQRWIAVLGAIILIGNFLLAMYLTIGR